ncbi:S-(hydroxymethyl)glutathione dehydrogenase/alcohol dehydrogenase [Tamaricihabitans halophyticus]|uniref:S-(Hydroxymethyl)glutathione dehydrogenase/alcohol dehydrogenase n=1 Tax=Tamaricihabitans halophyticus TaxID=1262583 RepID=A0A4R2QKN2_9PSEU|nr:Zn-dependent alcohol dehydrogenase [Tamaricihabitans halophyticus]TCP49324.1 S-(hydroxymethyl)glutathione dehydrogenase/alcohol dehydrogenase [Tamaricihabitans halophyticus]
MVNAVVFTEPNAEPEIHDLQLPELGPADVRIRIAAAGVCHSDLSMVNGTLGPEFPVVPGHEASGTVTEVGSAVRRVTVGQRVVLNWAPACRSCWFCLNRQPWLCRTAEGVASVQRGHLADGTEAHAAVGVGAFAEEVVLPEQYAVPLPDGVPLDLAALLGCAVLTGIGAVRNTARVRSGESVVVIGLGGIGLSAVIGARLAGAGPIIAVDLAPEKEEPARLAGATHFLRGDAKVAKEIRGYTGRRGADHAFECVGAPATIRQAWDSVRRGGQCTVVGVGGKDQRVEFSPLELFHFARTLTSSVYGDCDPDRDIPMLAEQVVLGRLDLAGLVSSRIGLDGVADAFTRMRSGQGVRSLIELSGA